MLADLYAESFAQWGLKSPERKLFSYLETVRIRFNFPAISPAVGQLITWLCKLHGPRVIFEFGSGIGHSAFWAQRGLQHLEAKLILTEKNPFWENFYREAPWPPDWKKSQEYRVEDAFCALETIEDDRIGFCLIDGQKARYLEFLQKLIPKLSSKAIVVIDNAFWKGSFLDTQKSVTHSSSLGIQALHEWLRESTQFEVSFLPVSDGLFLLSKI